MKFRQKKLFLWLLIFSSLIQGNDGLAQAQTKQQQVIWHIKAMHPDGYTLDVKAFGKDGAIYDVKALEDIEQRYIMDVTAFKGAKKLPVKVLVSEAEYKPVVAIDEQGNTYEVRALNRDGSFMEVKGVRSSGYIIHIKAVDEKGEFLGVKAISPSGNLNDVKGIKMYDKRVEVNLHGVDVHAHVVALPQLH